MGRGGREWGGGVGLYVDLWMDRLSKDGLYLGTA